MLKELPRSRSPQPAVDLNGFFKMVGEALKLRISTEGAPTNGAPIYVEEYAQERLTKEDQSTDLIVFRVVSAKIAPTTNSGTIPKRPSLRDQRTHPTKGSGYQINTYGWWEQVQVEFTILSRSNINGNTLAEWFHLFLMEYGWMNKYFLGRGIENFEFVERKDDPVDHNTGQEIYVRRLIYQFRMNRLYATESRLLTDIEVNAGIGNEVDSFDIRKPIR